MDSSDIMVLIRHNKYKKITMKSIKTKLCINKDHEDNKFN